MWLLAYMFGTPAEYRLKEVTKDLKEIYQAPTEEIALAALDRFEKKWGRSHISER